MRDRLLDAAHAVFLEGGLSALTMRRLGRDAGVSAMAAYAYFADKDALVAALVDRYFVAFVEQMRQAFLWNDPVERLRDCGRQVYRYAVQNPQQYALIFVHDKDVRRPKATYATDTRGAMAYQLLTQLVQDGVDAGEIRGASAAELALAIWAQTHGMLSMLVTHRLFMPIEQFEHLFWASLDVLMDPYLRVPYGRRAAAEASDGAVD